MNRLPMNSRAVIWTDKGLKIVRTDSCGDMADLSSYRPASLRGPKPLPESLTRIARGEAPDQQPGQA